MLRQRFRRRFRRRLDIDFDIGLGSEPVSPAESDGAVQASASSDDDLMFGEITLESILAEYKGKAYIAGDKRTPPSVLQEKTERIILETAGGKYIQRHPPLKTEAESGKEKTTVLQDHEEIAKAQNRASVAEGVHIPGRSDGALKPDGTPFIRLCKNRGADAEVRGSTADEVNQAIERQTRLEEDTKKSVRKVFGILSRNQGAEDEETDLDLDSAVFLDEQPRSLKRSLRNLILRPPPSALPQAAILIR